MGLKRILALAMIVVVLCTGCAAGSNITLTTEQNDLIAEYAAGVMLKYSFENEWNYTKIRNSKIGTSSSEKATIGSKGSASSVMSSTGSTTQTNHSTTETKSSSTETKSSGTISSTQPAAVASDPMKMLADGLGMSGATIKVSNYVTSASYPGGDLVLSVPATTGKKVVAVEFEIYNSTATPIICNTIKNNVVLKLTVNGTGDIYESFTILQNDLINLMNINIAPNGKYTAVAIFMVPEGAAANITSMSVSVSLNGGAAVSHKIK